MLLALQALYNLVGLFGHLLVDIAALVVILVDAYSLCQGFLQVLLHQQRHGLRTVLHASRSVDARPDLEHDVAHGQFASRQSANVNDGLQPHRGSLVELLETMEGQGAVLAVNRHQVGSNAERTEVEQGDEARERDAVVLGKGLHELESHATAGEVVVGIRRVGTLGIQYRHGGGHDIVGNMVVADDEVNATLISIRNFVDCLDAAIEHNNQFYTCLCCIVYSLDADTIALLVTIRDIVFHVGIVLLQKLIHQSYCRATIHIVVAIHHDAFLAAHGVI